jgi:hypothetical protein
LRGSNGHFFKNHEQGDSCSISGPTNGPSTDRYLYHSTTDSRLQFNWNEREWGRKTTIFAFPSTRRTRYAVSVHPRHTAPAPGERPACASGHSTPFPTGDDGSREGACVKSATGPRSTMRPIVASRRTGNCGLRPGGPGHRHVCVLEPPADGRLLFLANPSILFFRTQLINALVSVRVRSWLG